MCLRCASTRMPIGYTGYAGACLRDGTGYRCASFRSGLGAVVGGKTHLSISIATDWPSMTPKAGRSTAPGTVSHSIHWRTSANPLHSEITLIVGRKAANLERIDGPWARIKAFLIRARYSRSSVICIRNVVRGPEMHETLRIVRVQQEMHR